MHRLLISIACLVVSLGACGGDDSGAATDGGGVRDSGITFDAAPGADSGVASDGSSAMDAPGRDGAMTGEGGIMLACTVEELMPIAQCAADNCIMLPEGGIGGDAALPDPGALAACIIGNCGGLLLGVSPACRNCLIAGVGMNIDEITMQCASGLPMP